MRICKISKVLKLKFAYLRDTSCYILRRWFASVTHPALGASHYKNIFITQQKQSLSHTLNQKQNPAETKANVQQG